MIKNEKLSREDFFGNPLMLKLASIINKKSLEGFNFLYLKDKKTIKLLKNNTDWLEIVGITIEWRQKKKHLFVKWVKE
jgi:hypothetical protein